MVGGEEVEAGGEAGGKGVDGHGWGVGGGERREVLRTGAGGWVVDVIGRMFFLQVTTTGT